MLSPQDRIDGFVSQVRRRLHLRRFAFAAVWSLLVASAVMLLVALTYVIQGYAVDRWWYIAAALAAVMATLVVWIAGLTTHEAAARFADKYYQLHDALVSYLHFSRQGKSDGFYALQRKQTADGVSDLDPAAIDWQPSKRPSWTALVLVAAAVLLAFKQPSQAVQDKLAVEGFTLTTTASQKAALEELVRELNEQTNDPLERELLAPDKLREMVEALEETRDQKEALRQQAKLEQLLNQKRTKLEQKRDEHLLSEAAKELDKARETKRLGEKLAQKKYDRAAQDLQDMKPEASKKLTEQQKELAKLAAASKRMAAAVRNQRSRTSPGKGGESPKGGESQTAAASAQSGKSGSANGGSGSGGGELGDAIEDLEDAIAEWSDALSEAERQEKLNGKCDSNCQGKCNACRTSALASLDNLSKYLKRMSVRRSVCDKLASLCKACSQCQGGLCQSQCSSPKNGKGIGSSSNLARRNERDELLDNGQTESLKGIKGQGPSQTTVETADEGTGTSSRTASSKQRNFERHFESFVSREDVPEEVRTGVKRYFESIHQIEEQP